MIDFESQIFDVFSQAWLPPPTLLPSEWADQYRMLSPEASAEHGQWRTSRTPYLKKPLDSFFDSQYEEHVWMFGSQLGKTEAMVTLTGYIMHMKPGPMLTVQPTLEMAETYSTDRFSTMVRDTKVLSSLIDLKSRNSGNKVLYKKFPGGHNTMAGANSPASLAMRPVRYVFADEIDRYPSSAGQEGDPVKLAKARTATFNDSKLMLTSTPTIKGASRIELAFDESRQHEYFVPCPHCGEFHTLKWKNRVIPQNPKTGEYLTDKIYFACPVNGCEIHEQHKHQMLAQGEWRLVKSGKMKRRIGWRINSIYSPWMRWRELAEEFIESKDEPDLLQPFINTKLAESWELRSQAGLMMLPNKWCEDYDKDSLPDQILFFTCAVDKQRDRLEILVQGWGEKRERWNVEHHVIWGNTSHLAVYDELDEWLLSRKYKVGKRTEGVAITLIDSGDDPDPVYNFVKPRQGRRVFAIKGSSKYYAPLANMGRQVGRQRVTLYEIGTDTAKDQILGSSLKLPKPTGEHEVNPNYIHFPKWFDQELFDQLSMSEYLQKNTGVDRLGRKKRITRLFSYEKLRERNEQLDLHVYNLAAYGILNPDIETLKAKAETADNAISEPEKPKPKSIARKPRKRQRKNWVQDF